MRRIVLSALYITGPSENSSSEPLISQKMKKKMNSGLKGAVFVLPYFIVKHLSDPLEIPLASRLLGPYETSFRTFDATDYQPIGKQEGLLKISIEILFGARCQLI